MTGVARDEWAHLLACLGQDREAAERKYGDIRRRLESFFRWKGHRDPGALADETIARVARYLYRREETILSPWKLALFLRTAFMVSRETFRKDRRRSQVEALYQRFMIGVDPTETEADKRRLEAVHEVVDALPREDRDLVVTYYIGTGRVRIQDRKRLAADRRDFEAEPAIGRRTRQGDSIRGLYGA